MQRAPRLLHPFRRTVLAVAAGLLTVTLAQADDLYLGSKQPYVVQQDPATEGKVAVETILKLKKGETVPPVINVPVTIVTKANVDQFRSLFK